MILIFLSLIAVIACVTYLLCYTLTAVIISIIVSFIIFGVCISIVLIVKHLTHKKENNKSTIKKQ